MKRCEPPQWFLEKVLDSARKTWHGELSEMRVMHNRNGASIMDTERHHFGVEPKSRKD